MKARLEPRINLAGRTALETVIPLATPFIVFVDPASSCNFKCSFCPTGHRDMIAETGRFQGVMKFDVFRKVIDDLAEFEKPLKVLRMYKDGEPFLNKRLAEMVAYAKRSGRVDYIDTTTNGTFLSPERVGPVLEAGIDKINISVDGMTEETYLQFTGFKFDFATFIENVKWIYANKGNCEIVVKIPGELITEAQRQAVLRYLRRSLRPHLRRELCAVLAGIRYRGTYRRQDQQGHLSAGYRRHRYLPVYFLRLFGERRRAGQLMLPGLGPQAGDRRCAAAVDERDMDFRADECAASAASRGSPAAKRRLRQLRPAQPLPA